MADRFWRQPRHLPRDATFPSPSSSSQRIPRNGGRLSSAREREGTMDYFQENILSHHDQSEILTSVDLKIAFGVEKLLNLEMLAMETARRTADLRDPQSISLHMPFEFDVLHTIVYSEVRELEKLAGSIHMDIQSVVDGNKVEEPDPENRVEGKLQAATDSFNQMQELIATIRRESATFDKVLQPSLHQQFSFSAPTAGVGYENFHTSPHTTTHPEDQLNVLHMLQKSIASELDLGKELCDTSSIVEELKMKLYQAEEQLYFLEESGEAIYQRMLSAENASQIFLGTSKDLLAKFNSASVCKEGDFKSKLGEGLSNDSMRSLEEISVDSDNNANQEPLRMQTPSLPEFSTLRDKIRQLEEWLRDSGSQPQWSSLPRGVNERDRKMTRSEIITFQDIVNELKVAISKAELRTQSAEEGCTHLTQTNDQLYAELNSDRAGLLEKRLKESDTQLEHAKASVDAVVEQQSMLKASMSDMEQMIEDLKDKFLKAETRAENAELKCKLLTDTNLELSEELSFLRGRLEGLENSLRQANQLKTSNSKDIGIKTKNISDLVAKLALERERLHLQIVTLTNKNKMLAQKCRENVNGTTSLSKKATAKEGELRAIDAKDEAVNIDSSSTQTKVTPTVNILRDQEAEVTLPLEDNSGARALETLRSIELNWKYTLITVLVWLAAIIVYLLYKEDNSVQQLLRQSVGF